MAEQLESEDLVADDVIPDDDDDDDALPADLHVH